MKFYCQDGLPKFRYYVEGAFADRTHWRAQMFSVPNNKALAAYGPSDAAHLGSQHFLERGRLQVIAYPRCPPGNIVQTGAELAAYECGRVVATYVTLPAYELRLSTIWRLKTGLIPRHEVLRLLRANTGIQ